MANSYNLNLLDKKERQKFLSRYKNFDDSLRIALSLGELRVLFSYTNNLEKDIEKCILHHKIHNETT